MNGTLRWILTLGACMLAFAAAGTTAALAADAGDEEQVRKLYRLLRAAIDPLGERHIIYMPVLARTDIGRTHIGLRIKPVCNQLAVR